MQPERDGRRAPRRRRAARSAHLDAQQRGGGRRNRRADRSGRSGSRELDQRRHDSRLLQNHRIFSQRISSMQQRDRRPARRRLLRRFLLCAAPQTHGDGAQIGHLQHGRLLQAVMAFHLYNDSKSFVDKPIRFPADTVVADFERQFPTDADINADSLRAFVDDHFEPEGFELDE